MKNHWLKLKIGQSVMLKSGGPIMQIMAMDRGDCLCRWFYKGAIKKRIFHSSMLKPCRSKK